MPIGTTGGTIVWNLKIDVSGLSRLGQIEQLARSLAKSSSSLANSFKKLGITTVNVAKKTLELSNAQNKYGKRILPTIEAAKRYEKALLATWKASDGLVAKNRMLQVSMKPVAGGFAVMGTAVKSTGAAFQKFSQNSIRHMLSLKSMVGKITHYITFSIGVQLVMALRTGMQQLVDIFSEFERAATNAATISGYLGSSFVRVREHIKDVSRELGRNTVFSAIAVANSFYSLASAGYDVSKMTSKELLPILDYAAATQADLEEATKAVLVTLKQFQLDLTDTQHVVDVFTTSITSSFETMEKLKEGMKYAGPMAGILGISLEETASALTSLVDRGLEGGQAGQRLNMVFTKLLKPTAKSTKMLEKLGLTFEDINPEAKSLTEILFTLQGAGFGAAEAATMFRARTAGAAAVLVENADAVARMTTRLEMADGITRQVAAAQEKTLWGALTKTSNRMIEVATNIGEKLAPIVIYLADLIQKSLAPALEFLGGMFGFISNNAEVFKNVFKVLLPILVIYIAKTKIFNKLLKSNLRIRILGLIALIKEKTLLIASTIAKIANTIATQGLTASVIQAKAAILGMNLAMLSSPITWFVIAIGAVVAAFYIWGKETEKVTEQEKELDKVLGPLQKKVKAFFGLTVPTEYTRSVSDFSVHMKTLATVYKDKTAIEFWQKLADAMGLATWADALYAAGNDKKHSAILQIIKDISELTVSKWDLIQAGYILTESFKAFEIALKYATDATTELAGAEKALNAINEITIENREQYLDAQERIVKAEENYVKTQRDLIKYTGKILQTMRSLPGNLEFYINQLEVASEANAKWSDREEKRIRLALEETRAIQDLSEAMMKYGASSDEVVDAENRLRDTIEARIDIVQELNDLNMEATNSFDMVKNIIDTGVIPSIEDMTRAELELSDAEIQMLGYARDMIQFREDLMRAKADEAIWSGRLAALDSIREDHTKFLTERLLQMYEAQNKLFDIELKLYKLRTEEDEQLDDMFQSLAEQGLINEEMVQQYSDLKKAQGGVLQLNHQFAKVMGELTPEQAEWAEQLMNSVEGSDDYNEALAELSGVGGLDTILSMKDAQDLLATTTGSLSDDMIPLIQNMVDMGLVSSDTAKKFYDFIDNAYEMAAGEKKLAKQQDDIFDGFSGVLDVISQLSQSMITGEEGAETFTDIWDDLTKALGIGEMTMEEVALLTRGNAEDTANLSKEEYILAAALKATASDLGIYEVGRTGANLAEEMGIIATKDLSDAYGVLLGKVNESLSPLYTYAQVIGGQEDAANRAKAALGDETTGLLGSVTMLYGLLSNESLWDWEIDGIIIGGQDVEAELERIKAELEIVKEKLKELEDAGESAAKGLWESFTDWLGGLPDWFGGTVVDPIKNAIGGLADWIGQQLTGDSNYRLIGEAQGGIVKAAKGMVAAQRGATILRGPTPVMAGEAGDEAFVPLEGVNKKYGENLIKYILPRYFPKLIERICIDKSRRGRRGGRRGRGDFTNMPLPRAMPMAIGGIVGMQAGGIAGGPGRLQYGMGGPQEIFIDISNVDNLKEYLDSVPAMSETVKAALIDGGQMSSDMFLVGTTDAAQTLFDAHADTAMQLDDIITTSASDMATTMNTSGKSMATAFGGEMLRYTNTMTSQFQTIINAISKLMRDAQYYSRQQNYQRGTIANKPTLGMFGEKGAEALIPLEGANKKFGRRILEDIIPRYYPELMRLQGGGTFGGGSTTYTSGDTSNENYTITGPINVTGVANAEDFSERLKFQMRSVRR